MARRQISRDELYRLARLGAELRLSALERERAEILRNFPTLGNRPSSSAGGGNPALQGRRRRRRMSAAERKSVSARMKRYWAARRKAKAKNA